MHGWLAPHLERLGTGPERDLLQTDKSTIYERKRVILPDLAVGGLGKIPGF